MNADGRAACGCALTVPGKLRSAAGAGGNASFPVRGRGGAEGGMAGVEPGEGATRHLGCPCVCQLTLRRSPLLARGESWLSPQTRSVPASPTLAVEPLCPVKTACPQGQSGAAAAGPPGGDRRTCSASATRGLAVRRPASTLDGRHAPYTTGRMPGDPAGWPASWRFSCTRGSVFHRRCGGLRRQPHWLAASCCGRDQRRCHIRPRGHSWPDCAGSVGSQPRRGRHLPPLPIAHAL